MEEAGKEEKKWAIQNGQTDKNGVPYITVYLDGGWSHRSYGHNYNAASGVVSFILDIDINENIILTHVFLKPS